MCRTEMLLHVSIYIVHVSQEINYMCIWSTQKSNLKNSLESGLQRKFRCNIHLIVLLTLT